MTEIYTHISIMNNKSIKSNIFFIQIEFFVFNWGMEQSSSLFRCIRGCRKTNLNLNVHTIHIKDQHRYWFKHPLTYFVENMAISDTKKNIYIYSIYLPTLLTHSFLVTLSQLVFDQTNSNGKFTIIWISTQSAV